MKVKAFGLGFCAALLGFIAPAQAQFKNSLAISEVALKSIGMDTSAGPGHGQLAAAWAVNQILSKALGYRIGQSNAVVLFEQALEKEYGSEVKRAKAVPGDLIVANRAIHVGICMNNGCTKAVSNLASKSKLGWLNDAEFNTVFQAQSKIYRVKKTADKSQLKLSEQPSVKDLIFAANDAFREGNYWLAARFSNAVIKLDPNYGNAYTFRGMALHQLGKKEEAKADLEKAQKLLSSQKLPQSPDEQRMVKVGLEFVQSYLSKY